MVVRDHLGVVHICVGIRVDNIESPLHAELKAILFGLKEATSIHLSFTFREIEK